MELYLVRHGEARSKDVDPKRGLTEPGEADVQKVAKYLKGWDLSVGAIWHSGKTRAVQTAKIVAGAVASDEGIVKHDGLDPNDPVEPICQAIAESTANLMIVGHMPFLGNLVRTLLADRKPPKGIVLETAGVVCLERDADDVWTVAWTVGPSQL